MSQFIVRGKPGAEPTTAGPFEITAMMEGVGNCVRNWADVKKGEDVLIVAGYNDDPVVVQAFAAVSAEIGANVTIMYVRPPGLSGTVKPSDVVVQAFLAADVIFDLPFWSNLYSEQLNPTLAKNYYDLKKQGVLKWRGKGRWVDQFGTADALTLSGPAAKFPLPLLYEIAKKGKEIVSKGKQIRVTDGNGTDLTLPVANLAVQPRHLPPLGQGEIGCFMRGLVWTTGPYHPKPNGVLYFDESQVTGVPEEPVKLTIEDGQLTKIEGGFDAENLRLFFRKAPGGKLATEFSELGWGTNPKLPFKGGQALQRGGSAGGLSFAIGAFYSPQQNIFKVTFEIDTPTIYVDDELVVDKRRLLLLEDREVREAAKKYGDPDKLLAQFMVHEY